MKTNYKVSFVLLAGLLALPLVFTACSSKKQQEEISHYTCPMHPQIHMDKPGKCPICGMELVPVSKGGGEHKQDGDQSKNEKGISINPAHAQRIGVKTEAIATRDLSRTIRAFGRNSFSPELWVAQNEYLEAKKLGDASLLEATKRKLRTLGVSKEWMGKTEGLYAPGDNKPGTLEGFIAGGDALLLEKGNNAEILDEKGRLLGTGEVVSIGEVIDPETRLVRLLVKQTDVAPSLANAFIQLRVKAPIGRLLSVPTAAILFNGDHNMVYATDGHGNYFAKKIELGRQADDFYEVKGGVEEGELVVTNGHFLIDSETQIKTGGTSGGHQH